MSRCLSILVALVLLAGVCGSIAQNKPVDPPTVSITVSNQGELELLLTLTLHPVAELLSPLGGQGWSTNYTGRPEVTREIQPNQSTTLEVPSGIYGVKAVGRFSSVYRNGLPFPLSIPAPGFDSITNSEQWIFKLGPSRSTNAPAANSAGKTIRPIWVREVQPRRLHPYAMYPIPPRRLHLDPPHPVPPVAPLNPGLRAVPTRSPRLTPADLQQLLTIPTRTLRIMPVAPPNTAFPPDQTNGTSKKLSPP